MFVSSFHPSLIFEVKATLIEQSNRGLHSGRLQPSLQIEKMEEVTENDQHSSLVG